MARPKGSRPQSPVYGSDLIVDILKRFGIKYVSFNPGASFRGLHESIVNYGGNNNPTVVECNHEEIAVQVAHGYTRTLGTPMAVILHNVVGLLKATWRSTTPTWTRFPSTSWAEEARGDGQHRCRDRGPERRLLSDGEVNGLHRHRAG